MTVSTQMELQSDAELVEQARRGRMEAFEALIGRHFGLVHAIASARLGDREAAEDLAQEVFLRASLAIEQVRDADRFAQWLAQITRNLSISWLRQAQRRSALAPMIPLDEQACEIPDRDQRGGRDLMETQEQSRILWESIRALPPAQRELILLHVAEGMSAAEIAARLGVHRTTVSRQIQRSVESLRRQIEPLLRATAPALRAPRRASARTVALVAALWAMTPSARAAVEAAAAASMPTAEVGALAFIRAAAAAGGKFMVTGKGIATLAGAAALAGGTVYLGTSAPPSEQTLPPGAFVAMTDAPAHGVQDMAPGSMWVAATYAPASPEAASPETAPAPASQSLPETPPLR